MPPIVVNPSQSLVEKINSAISAGGQIYLRPGIHRTNPGSVNKIKVGSNGLTIKADPNPRKPGECIIKRPDFSILTERPDDNYGLFFIPADPSNSEISEISTWKTHTQTEDGHTTTFQYAVIVRGRIEISGLTLNCNMGMQHLREVYDNATPDNRRPAEHSCMLGFSGSSKKWTENNPDDPGHPIEKRVFVAFEEVVLSNIKTINGGFADDIWISRGYFNPNIVKVKISHIRSEQRVDNHRATISFSGLAERVEIEDADIYRLECEETSRRWSEFPRLRDEYIPSIWKLKQITADYIDIAAKGKAIWMVASHLYTKVNFYVYQVGGEISNCTFHKTNPDGRLHRFNNMIFQNVSWLLHAKPDGQMDGLRPTAEEDETCEVQFFNNQFNAVGEFTHGSLISSGHTPRAANKVWVKLENCVYDARFNSSSNAELHAVGALEKGVWYINMSDFGTRTRAEAIKENTAFVDVYINPDTNPFPDWVLASSPDEL